MTRAEFVDRAVRAAEKALHVPPGWWGTYSDVHGPGAVRVRWSGQCWAVRHDGVLVSRHDSRSYAITAARRIAAEGKEGSRG